MKRASKKKTYVKKKCKHVHRLVVEEFIGRKLKRDEVVHHKDGDKFNNNVWNLQIMTQSEHMKVHWEEISAAKKQRKEVAL